MTHIFLASAICLLLPSTIADDDDNDDGDDLRLVAVRTLLLAPDTTPSPVVESIDIGMDSITDADDRRQLRSSEKGRRLRCSYCTYYPSYYKGCWVKFVWTPKCRTRNLVVHQKLTDEAVSNLNDKERRRYLQNSETCAQAIDDMDDLIIDASNDGIVPPLPANTTFVEECIFEEIDD